MSQLWHCPCGYSYGDGRTSCVKCGRVKPEPTTPQTTRDYDDRCVNCRHDVWQNELVGDCRAFDKDVYHHSTHPCDRYERKSDA